jgi:hypothetical protein
MFTSTDAGMKKSCAIMDDKKELYFVICTRMGGYHSFLMLSLKMTSQFVCCSSVKYEKSGNTRSGL